MTRNTHKVSDWRCPICGGLTTKAKWDNAAVPGECSDGCQQEAQWRRICPPLFRETDPARLPTKQLREVLAWEPGPLGLLLHGKTDTFKTRCAYLLLKKLHFGGMEVMAWNSLDFAVRYAIERKSDDVGESFIRRLTTVPVLMLDDIGKEAGTDAVEKGMFHIIDKRASLQLPIIATTNMVGDDFRRAMASDRGAPFVRRLKEFCRPIPFGVGKNGAG